jgi:protoheme IX farnesyltransferase
MAKPKLSDYIQLTKPSILLLVLLTGAAALVLEGNISHQPLRFLEVILGLALTGGCANALNQYFERDIDAQMGRTRARRPLPRHAITPRAALIFAITLGVLALILFALWFNLLSAACSLGTILFYSFFYTLWLKPKTYLNIVIGGAAGAMAPVIAWAAATGTLAVTPWILFLIIFFWTPPHFWALALCVKRDYQSVAIPMLPVIKGDAETRRQILVYTMWMVAISLALLLVKAGLIYLLVALALGIVFLWKAYHVWRQNENTQAWGLFKYSIVYLFALFIAMMADKAVH